MKQALSLPNTTNNNKKKIEIEIKVERIVSERDKTDAHQPFSWKEITFEPTT